MTTVRSPAHPDPRAQAHRHHGAPTAAGRGLRFALLLALGGCATAPTPTSPSAAAPTPLEVRLVGLNDFHGYLDPSPGSIPDPSAPGGVRREALGGVAHLASAIRTLTDDRPHHAVIGVGDLIGASPLNSSLLREEPTIEALSRLGMKLSPVGNHEFDYGLGELMRLQQGGCHAAGCLWDDDFPGAGFQYLAANVRLAQSGAPLFPPSAVLEFDGVRIGFIGVTLEGTPNVTLRQHVRHLRFLPEAPTINAEAARLRAQGIEALVALIHEGARPEGASVDPATCAGLRGPLLDIVAKLDPAIDLVLSAHSHQAYVCRYQGRLITQGMPYGRALTVVDLKLDRRSGDVLDVAAQNLPVRSSVYPPDPEFAALAARAAELTAGARERVIGRLAVERIENGPPGRESPLSRLIADAQLEFGRAQGAQLALMNFGGIRADLPEAPRPDRAITYGDVAKVHPFGNDLILLELSGAELLAVLNEQGGGNNPGIKLTPSRGFSYAVRHDGAGRIEIPAAEVRLDGRVLDPTAHYRIVVNSFLAGGGDDLPTLARGRNAQTLGLDRDALIQYLGAAERTAPSDLRIRRLD